LVTAVVTTIADFTNGTRMPYLFISAICVGCILSMDRAVLVRGFFKIFVPLAVGSIAAMLVGTAVGAVLGLGAKHTLFYIVIPIMAGGVGEGAIPLSIGYSGINGTTQGEEFARVLPPIMFGSLVAVGLSPARAASSPASTARSSPSPNPPSPTRSTSRESLPPAC